MGGDACQLRQTSANRDWSPQFITWHLAAE